MKIIMYFILVLLCLGGMVDLANKVFAQQNVPFTKPPDGYVGNQYYAIKLTNVGTSTINVPFILMAKKIALSTPLTNTDDVCVAYNAGIAVCPQVNTPGNDRIGAGNAVVLDQFWSNQVSVVAASGTQTIYIRAWY